MVRYKRVTGDGKTVVNTVDDEGHPIYHSFNDIGFVSGYGTCYVDEILVTSSSLWYSYLVTLLQRIYLYDINRNSLIRYINESVGIGNLVEKGIKKFATNSIGIVEDIYSRVVVLQSDSLVFRDRVKKSCNRMVLNTITTGDELSNIPRRVMSDIINTCDVLLPHSIRKVCTNNITVGSTIIRGIVSHITDTIYSSDICTTEIAKIITNVVNVLDTSYIGLMRYLTNELWIHSDEKKSCNRMCSQSITTEDIVHTNPMKFIWDTCELVNDYCEYVPRKICNAVLNVSENFRKVSTHKLYQGICVLDTSYSQMLTDIGDWTNSLFNSSGQYPQVTWVATTIGGSCTTFITKVRVDTITVHDGMLKLVNVIISQILTTGESIIFNLTHNLNDLIAFSDRNFKIPARFIIDGFSIDQVKSLAIKHQIIHGISLSDRFVKTIIRSMWDDLIITSDECATFIQKVWCEMLGVSDGLYTRVWRILHDMIRMLDRYDIRVMLFIQQVVEVAENLAIQPLRWINEIISISESMNHTLKKLIVQTIHLLDDRVVNPIKSVVSVIQCSEVFQRKPKTVYIEGLGLFDYRIFQVDRLITNLLWVTDNVVKVPRFVFNELINVIDFTSLTFVKIFTEILSVQNEIVRKIRRIYDSTIYIWESRSQLVEHSLIETILLSDWYKRVYACIVTWGSSARSTAGTWYTKISSSVDTKIGR